MEAIKKKMSMLKLKLKEAEDEANDAEDKLYAKQSEADEVENEVLEKTKERCDLEDDLEKEEERYTNLKFRLDEAAKMQDENQRAHKELCNRGQVDTDKLERLEREIVVLQDKIEEVEEQYSEAVAKLEEAEAELDREEERFNEADARSKELEVEAVQIGNLLRSMEINEGNAAKSQSKSTTRVEEWKDKVDCKICDAEEKEDESAELEKALIDLEQDVHEAREKYQQVKSDYDALLAEVAEI